MSVVLPSYCSWRHLEANLPALLEEAERFGAEVLVTDDASPDDTVERVRENFPTVRLVARDTNGGFGENCNTGVREATGEFVYLMNSDVLVQPGFLDPLVECLERERDVFCVSSIAMSEDGKEVLDGPRWGAFRRGHLKWKKLDRSGLLEATEPVPTLYAVGAHVLIVKDTIEPFVNGPVFCSPAGVDPTNFPQPIPEGEKPVDLFIAAIKQHRLGRRLYLRFWRPGRRIDFQTRPVPRTSSSRA